MTFLYLSVVAFTFVNLIVLVVNIKLYTEITKVRELTRKDK